MTKFALGVHGAGVADPSPLQLDRLSGAAGVSLRPSEPGGGGHYFVACAGSLGATFSGAQFILWNLAWTSPSLQFVLHRLSVVAYISGAATGGYLDFRLVRWRGVTGVSGIAATFVVPAPKGPYGRSAIRRVAIANNQVLSFTGNPIVQDTTPTRELALGPPTVASPSATLGIPCPELVLYDLADAGAAPVILQANQGLAVNYMWTDAGATPATVYVMAEWAEESA